MKTDLKRSFIRFLVISIFFSQVSFAHSQKKEERPAFQYFNKTEAGIGLGFGSFKGNIDTNNIQKSIRNDQISGAVQMINGVCISGRFGLGVGLGAEWWQKGMFFPVFVHLYYDFREGETTPFAYMNLGKAFGDRYETYYYASGKGGFLFSIGAGYKIKVSKRFQFEYALFYRYQAILTTYQTEYASKGEVHTTTTDYKAPYHFGGFRIGILFR
jgi:hypothetical protein